MKDIFIISITITILFSAIYLIFFKNNQNQTVNQLSQIATSPTPTPIDPTLSIGTFKGMLPCADCSGLETEINFIRSNTSSISGSFNKKEIYVGKSLQPILSKGTWAMINGIPANKKAEVYKLSTDQPNNFEYYLKVGETKIKLLDNNLKEIKSPFNNTLTKIEAPMLANPASIYCVKIGGRSEIKTDATGANYGMCLFTDGRECEEWALFRDNKCISNE